MTGFRRQGDGARNSVGTFLAKRRPLNTLRVPGETGFLPRAARSILLGMSDPSTIDLPQFIRSIPDFPKPGILFRDITPLLADGQALRSSVIQLADHFRDTKVDLVAAAEARGFIFATPLALELGAGFVPVRKPGKLPFDTHAFHYELEYGSDALEIHIDGVEPGQNVLLVDDLLATGGTMEACCRLIERARANVVACAFVVELTGLGGSKRIAPHRTVSLVKYD